MATVIGDVELGAGSSVWPGAVLRGDFGSIRVGERTSIQDNVVIHAGDRGTTIGSDCVIGHLAHIEDASIGDGCLVGVSAAVLTGARMHSGSAAAAGAVLTGALEVPAGMRAQGVPARLVPAAGIREAMIDAARRYAEMAQRYVAELDDVHGTGADPT